VLALGELPGWTFLCEAPERRSTFWLTCATVDPAFGDTRDAILDRLAAADIEARPVWKPMHAQPVFRGCRLIGGRVADALFAHGLCLPSGSRMSPSERDRVIATVCDAHTS
jgi:pyridoxal phosphate-dependent aminotransferase EpsN